MKISMKKILLCIALIASAFAASAASDEASTLIADASARLSAAKSVTATCKITSASGIENATLIMSGSKFFIKSPHAEIWYDGTTLWSYSRQTNEVTLSEPTPEEISQINPLAVIEAFTASYTPSLLAPAAGKKNIKLSAKSPSQAISSAEISLNSSTLTPSAITLILSSGQKITIAISSLKFGGKLPESTFTYRISRHPSAVLVDLR